MVDAKTSAAISALSEQIDSIHHENNLYWKQGVRQTMAARAEHQARQDRLETIRADLAQLQSGKRLTSLTSINRNRGQRLPTP